MGLAIVDLFVVASIPVVKVLLISAIGLFLAFERVDILGEHARNHLNKILFYVFNPALMAGNLARTVTLESFLSLWFMPVNILITFVIGSILGWILVKVTKPPKHLKGLIIGACSAGNMGNLPIILVPAMCKERSSPFGAPEVCEKYGLAYASLSMAIGGVYLWLYVYNIVRISSTEAGLIPDSKDSNIDAQEPLLLTSVDQLSSSSKSGNSMSHWISRFFKGLSKKINLKAVFAPSTIGAIIGFAVGIIAPLRHLLIGTGASLHVVGDSANMLGDAAIPALTLIVGANLLKGFKGSGIQLRIVMSIVAVRFIVLPVLGIFIVKGVVDLGLVPSDDKLLVFILLLQYCMPPAMNIGTITQLFGAGQSECSVIMLWTYAVASVAVTLWSTLFLWIVA
uniref:Auxin efflux carrier family protein n=1 Tax=Opuntia streptacantha TaxID=393608 RepID=A0A7C9EB02_OPUST